MHIVHVHCTVKPDCVDAFKDVTTENARNSVQEPGVARFDVIQQQDDPTKFVLVEVYRQASDVDEHKKTAHYKAWAETATPLLAGDRSKVLYTEVFPDADGWD